MSTQASLERIQLVARDGLGSIRRHGLTNEDLCAALDVIEAIRQQGLERPLIISSSVEGGGSGTIFDPIAAAMATTRPTYVTYGSSNGAGGMAGTTPVGVGGFAGTGGGGEMDLQQTTADLDRHAASEATPKLTGTYGAGGNAFFAIGGKATKENTCGGPATGDVNYNYDPALPNTDRDGQHSDEIEVQARADYKAFRQTVNSMSDDGSVAVAPSPAPARVTVEGIAKIIHGGVWSHLGSVEVVNIDACAASILKLLDQNHE